MRSLRTRSSTSPSLFLSLICHTELNSRSPSNTAGCFWHVSVWHLSQSQHAAGPSAAGDRSLPLSLRGATLNGSTHKRRRTVDCFLCLLFKHRLETVCGPYAASWHTLPHMCSCLPAYFADTLCSTTFKASNSALHTKKTTTHQPIISVRNRHRVRLPWQHQQQKADKFIICHLSDKWDANHKTGDSKGNTWQRIAHQLGRWGICCFVPSDEALASVNVPWTVKNIL